MNGHSNRIAAGLFVSLILFCASGTGDIQAAGPAGKLDPYLKVLLRGQPVLGAQTVERGDKVEVIVRAREDLTPALQRLGADVRSVLGDGAIMTALVPRGSIA